MNEPINTGTPEQANPAVASLDPSKPGDPKVEVIVTRVQTEAEVGAKEVTQH